MGFVIGTPTKASSPDGSKTDRMGPCLVERSAERCAASLELHRRRPSNMRRNVGSRPSHIRRRHGTDAETSQHRCSDSRSARTAGLPTLSKRPLFRPRPDLGALLLERLTPRSLAEAPTDEQITVQARLARKLAVPAPAGIGRLADDGIVNHLDNLTRDCPDLLNPRLTDAAREATRDLGNDSTATLTHGDLHSANVHQDHYGRWRVLDPNPRVGTIAFESHTVVVERPRLGEVIRAGGRELRRRLALFSEVAEVDPSLAERLCQARAVMSALYEQTRSNSRLAAELRWMAETLTPAAHT